jgi:hypothetical protein
MAHDEVGESLYPGAAVSVFLEWRKRAFVSRLRRFGLFR